jgi:hypothetical protein
MDQQFAPAMPAAKVAELKRGWLKAVSKAKGWTES